MRPFTRLLWPLVAGVVSFAGGTGELPANTTEATGIVIIARWPLENNINVRWAQVLHTEI